MKDDGNRSQFFWGSLDGPEGKLGANWDTNCYANCGLLLKMAVLNFRLGYPIQRESGFPCWHRSSIKISFKQWKVVAETASVRGFREAGITIIYRGETFFLCSLHEREHFPFCHLFYSCVHSIAFALCYTLHDTCCVQLS